MSALANSANAAGLPLFSALKSSSSSAAHMQGAHEASGGRQDLPQEGGNFASTLRQRKEALREAARQPASATSTPAPRQTSTPDSSSAVSGQSSAQTGSGFFLDGLAHKLRSSQAELAALTADVQGENTEADADLAWLAETAAAGLAAGLAADVELTGAVVEVAEQAAERQGGDDGEGTWGALAATDATDATNLRADADGDGQVAAGRDALAQTTQSAETDEQAAALAMSANVNAAFGAGVAAGSAEGTHSKTLMADGAAADDAAESSTDAELRLELSSGKRSFNRQAEAGAGLAAGQRHLRADGDGALHAKANGAGNGSGAAEIAGAAARMSAEAGRADGREQSSFEQLLASSQAQAASMQTLAARAGQGMHSPHSIHAGQAAPANMQTPFGHAAWGSEVGDRLMWMVGRQEQRAELVLNPAQLGRVEISLSLRGEQTHAHFVAANPAVREALEEALPRLREMFADAGLQLGQAQVGADSRGGAAEQFAGGQFDQGLGRNRENSSRFSSDPDGSTEANMHAAQLNGGSAWLRQGSGMVDVFA